MEQPKHAPQTHDEHIAKVRATLAKIDPGMLALADACRDRFDAKLNGVQAEQDGEMRGMGRLSSFTAADAKAADDWLRLPVTERAFAKWPKEPQR